MSKDELLFITDSLGDVKEAQIVKIPTITITWGIHNNSFQENKIVHI